MFNSLKRVFGKAEILPEKLAYDEARDLLESQSTAIRSSLASREDTEPEMLYYLANDQNADVRLKIAANPSTPGHAFQQLTEDESDEVRCELAHKIGRLIPNLSAHETARLREYAIGALEKLAEDQVPRVRRIIAEEIKATANIPSEVVRKLANDLEISVAGPILEFSPLLSDTDLLEVIACGQVKGALDMIAKRQNVSCDVSDAVVATLDVSAVSTLLSNKNAQIREDTLDFIIDNAKDVESWHEPMAMRSELSLRALRRIAGFVAFSILADLSDRSDLDVEMQAFLKKKIRSRIEVEETLESDLSIDAEQIRQEVLQAAREGRLDAVYVTEAIECGQRDVVVESLAILSALPPDTVERIMRSKDGKPITGLVWKAGLPMRVALDIQRLIAHVPPRAMVMARNGVDFSLSADEMEMHLGLYI